MKILILQLARLGDILLVGPALQALKRQNPNAELVRSKFVQAAKGFASVDFIHELPTQSILEPLFSGTPNVEASTDKLNETLTPLRAVRFDRIINLSFSPASSWIVHSLANKETKISGYSRHTDGWLNIEDAVSSYFYAQVGPGRPNRIHLSDLFAAICDVDLEAQDWSAFEKAETKHKVDKNTVVLHVGASEDHKKVQAFQWGRMIKRLLQLDAKLSCILIGTKEEMSIAKEIIANTGDQRVTDLCGQTSFEELFAILKNSLLLIGADSSPVHIASLTGTQVINISVGNVNFWETGPRTLGSIVLRYEQASEFSSEVVAQAVYRHIMQQEVAGAYHVRPGLPSFFAETVDQKAEFEWNLAAALYLEGAFPVAEEMPFLLAVEKMQEMNSVVISQLKSMSANSKELSLLLDRADEVFAKIAEVNSSCGVFIRWLQTEKSKIPPLTLEDTQRRLVEIHQTFSHAMSPYDMSKIDMGTSGRGF
jgi:heptosyltransferase III